VAEPGRELAPDSEVRHEDWGALELGPQTYSRVSFVEVDLTELVTEGTLFEECVFQGVRFNVSEHRASAFVNCVFTRCSFFDATFSGCKLVGSRFEDCAFDLLEVVGGDWSFVALRGARLGSASFTDVRMREADLQGVNAVGGTLCGLDLSAADLSRADLAECDLRGSDLSSVDPRAVVLRDAVITGSQAVVLAGALGLDVRDV